MSRLRSQDAALAGGGLPTNQPTKADYQTDGQSGRDELNGIKQQLSSLDYIRTKCEERIRVLQPAANHLDLVTQTIQPSTLTKQKICQQSASIAIRLGSAGRDAASLRASISEQAASIFAMYFDSAGGGGSARRRGAGTPVLELDQFYGRVQAKPRLPQSPRRDGFAARRYGQQEFCEGEIDSPLADQEAEDAASPMEEYEVQYSAKNYATRTNKAHQLRDSRVQSVRQLAHLRVGRLQALFGVRRASLGSGRSLRTVGPFAFSGKAKNSFRNNMNPNLISQRQAELDLFLQQALTFNYSASERYLCARSMLYKFLAPGSLSPGAFASGPGGFGVSGAFGGAAGGATLPAPLRMMRQGSQDIIDGRQAEPAAQGGQAAAGAAAFAQSASTLGQLPEELRAIGSDLGGSGEVADQENVPLRILLLVMDEIFDVRERNKLIRKGIAAVLSKLVRALLGDRVNRRIVQFARVLTSADRVAYYLQSFRDSFWPQGQPAAPYPTRDSATLMRTRLLCRAKLLGSVSTELRQVLGNQTTRQGVARLFNMFQHANLNRRLVYVLLEGTVCLLFPDYRMDQAFRRMYARQRLRIGKPQQPEDAPAAATAKASNSLSASSTASSTSTAVAVKRSASLQRLGLADRANSRVSNPIPNSQLLHRSRSNSSCNSSIAESSATAVSFQQQQQQANQLSKSLGRLTVSTSSTTTSGLLEDNTEIFLVENLTPLSVLQESSVNNHKDSNNGQKVYSRQLRQTGKPSGSASMNSLQELLGSDLLLCRKCKQIADKP
uniref:Nexin_C domain-containing protein n=1 Tax=Macrostomum lignano TaxID=282301 RepID=A0A1I8FT42_9PLAT